MKPKTKTMTEENKRAERISKRIEGYHKTLTNIYEDLVDRDFKSAQKDLQFLKMELHLTIKSIEEDDF